MMDSRVSFLSPSLLLHIAFLVSSKRIINTLIKGLFMMDGQWLCG